ncbi:AraC family transcriptional regulator [Lacticaseibacillus paracasei]|uniref:AraC family transcriptional regulator n=1 Tax=Lacticaseibacillus paracasei TaxID=1597 RepID=UPI000E204CD8|nr:AraC family transcriptional regulator [Lacticaseibacillus paracasei]RDV41619.1 AraC family transcriptional regulator [Lacticaseibacillus paracasei subsp. paracasei]
MNQSTFQLLGNVASADFYLCEGSDITLISDNNAYNMKALAQEALKLRVPNSLTVIDLNNFHVGMIPIDHNQILTTIPHINTTNIPFNYQEITNFIGSRIFGVGKYFHSKSTRP